GRAQSPLPDHHRPPRLLLERVLLPFALRLLAWTEHGVGQPGPWQAARTGPRRGPLDLQLATPSASAGRLPAWEQSLYQALGDLSRALLLTHAGVDDQQRSGRGWDDHRKSRRRRRGGGPL